MNLTRIAPTPSGFLHEGNWFSFLLTLALARKWKARIGLRIDDLDQIRYRDSYLQDIHRTVSELGLFEAGQERTASPPAILYQSQRTEAYESALNTLRLSGRVYPSTQSRTHRRDRNRERDCLHGPAWEEAMDHPLASWWMRVDRPYLAECHTGWDEGGTSSIQVTGDYMIRRKPEPGPHPGPALPSTHLASLIDDRAWGTTHVVRGQDLLESTAIQIHLNTVLTGPEQEQFARIKWVHHPLLTHPDGRKLSKSAGARGVSLFHEFNTARILNRVMDLMALTVQEPWLTLAKAEADRINAVP